jgi:hypothetical protein
VVVMVAHISVAAAIMVRTSAVVEATPFTI